MIKCLPEEVQGKLRSGVAVPSLQQCVEELVLNSIDAGATCVCVRMDMDALKVQVIDNGAGMSADDMEKVGMRYHTSKCSSVEDLDQLRFYGFRGEAVASIVSLSALVQISSRVKSSSKTYARIFKDGKGLDVVEAEASRPSAGTTFVICNFFHNMPVRRKRMDAVLEGERIRHRLEAVSLMHPSVSFTLKNDCTSAMMVQLPKARDTYHRFVQIHGLGRAQSLGEIRHTARQFEVLGHVGKEGHYNNSLQFLYVNERLLLKTRIHKLLNFLLRRLRSSNQKSDSPEGQAATRSPKAKRNQDLHAIYVINIKCGYAEYDVCLEPAKTLIEFRDWEAVLLCVEEAVKAFLSRENLVAEFTRDDLDYASLQLLGTAGLEGEKGGVNNNITTNRVAAADNSNTDCAVAIKLASEAVHRKRKADGWQDGFLRVQVQCEEVEEEHGGGNGIGNGVKKQAEGSQRPTQMEKREESQDGSVTPESHGDLREQEVTSGSGAAEVTLGVQASPEQTDVPKEEKLGLPVVAVLEGCGKGLDAGSVGDAQVGPSHRKISLSHLYGCNPSQTPTPVSPLTKQSTRCEGVPSVVKRHISLLHSRCGPGDLSLPAKIPRVTCCQKVTLSKQSGSLDKFRRMYGKSNVGKFPSCSQTVDLLPHVVRCAPARLHHPVCGTEEHKRQASKTDFDLRPPTAVTESRSSHGHSKARGKSLAAKLRDLKQISSDRTEDKNHLQEDNNNNNNKKCLGVPQPEEEEEEAATTSGDWLPHFHTSVGKVVYVNKVTGLSRYGDPSAEGRRAACASDVTNVAVSVVSETGLESRCYPFQADAVLPFVPQPGAERVWGLGLEGRDGTETANSLTSVYSKWNNPVFVRPPAVGVDIATGHADGLAVKIHSILFPYRFSKAMIHSMKVMGQVDKKFLACLINTREEEEEEEERAAQPGSEGNLLVLVDQHAADERVRLERLVADSYEDDPDLPGERRLCSSTILPPLEINVTEEELRLLSSCQSRLQSLGLAVEFRQAAEPCLLVGKVPLCFMEKESNELRRGRPSVLRPVVEEYLQEQLELLRSAGRARGSLPLTVLKVLASLACHGAVKFNQCLSRDECSSLVEALSSCQLPFQCAHGRPSIAPLVDVLHLDKEQKETPKPNLPKLRAMYKAWKLFGDG